MTNNKVDLPSLFLLFIPVLFALSKLLTDFDAIDVAYLYVVVLIFLRHYFIMKKEK